MMSRSLPEMCSRKFPSATDENHCAGWKLLFLFCFQACRCYMIVWRSFLCRFHTSLFYLSVYFVFYFSRFSFLSLYLYVVTAGNEEDCKLYCRVEGSSAYYLLKEKVVDGTPCGPGTFNMCVNGICRKAGCNRVFLSEEKLGE